MIFDMIFDIVFSFLVYVDCLDYQSTNESNSFYTTNAYIIICADPNNENEMRNVAHIIYAIEHQKLRHCLNYFCMPI